MELTASSLEFLFTCTARVRHMPSSSGYRKHVRDIGAIRPLKRAPASTFSVPSPSIATLASSRARENHGHISR